MEAGRAGFSHTGRSTLQEAGMPNLISPSLFTSVGAMLPVTIFAALLTGCAAQEPTFPAEPFPPPAGAAGTGQGCQADQMSDQALVGKYESEALAWLEGCAWRIGLRDGHQFPGTLDFQPDRRTLGVVGGIVVWVRRG
jgi:hypothetical protein